MIKVGLDAGHYPGDGRVGRRFAAELGSQDEYILNRRVYEVVERLLKAARYTVVDIGCQDRSVTSRAKRAGEQGCDLVISIHHNAGGGRGATLYRNSNGVLGEESRKLQETLYASVKTVNKGNRSTPITSAALGVINSQNTKCPSVLIECAFMDNETDVKLICSANYPERMGEAIVDGILNYTGAGATGEANGAGEGRPAGISVKKSYKPWAYARVCNLTEEDPFLNVRSGPGTKYSIIRQLSDGNEVDVTEVYSNGWAGIHIVGLKGYVHAGYLSIWEQQSVKGTVTVAGCAALNVRKTPNGPAIAGTVKTGTVLEVIGSGKDSDGDTWTRVQYGSLTGYVWPKYLI